MAKQKSKWRVTGYRPCGEITEEMLMSEEWKNHWLEENIRIAELLGGKPILNVNVNNKAQ